MDQNHEARIRQRAYDLWLGENMPDGRSEAHWRQAEAELAQENGGQDPAEAAGPAASDLKPARKGRVHDAHDTLLLTAGSQETGTPQTKVDGRQRQNSPDVHVTR